MARRVLHVIPAVAARYGGPSAAVVGMCRALRAVGVDATIATTDADGGGRLPVEIGTMSTHAGVPAVFFRRQGGEGFKWSRPLADWLSRHVQDYDVVHVHAVFSHASIAAGSACRSAHVPYVVRPLGTLDPWSVRRKRLLKQVLLKFGAGDLLAGAASMHYTTIEEQRLAESELDMLPAGAVVPVGIDDEYFAAGVRTADDASPYVLALSRLEAKKQLEIAIDACHRLALDGRLGSWRFVIAGEGDPAYVAALRARAEAGPAAGRISFPGWVAGAAKLALMRGASLFILPSHQENFGVAMAEAMACGVPPVVTPGVNLSPEIAARRAGWLAEPTAADLAETLASAIADRDDRAARGQAARAMAEDFRWPAAAAALIELYDRLAAARPVRA